MSKILIIEDDRDICKNLKALLEGEGYSTMQAENGREALALLHAAAELPDAILLDLMMPVMDGFEFREKQLRDARLAGIPVAIMTAGGQVEEKKNELFAKAALKKPADIDDILNVVESLCAKA